MNVFAKSENVSLGCSWDSGFLTELLSMIDELYSSGSGHGGLQCWGIKSPMKKTTGVLSVFELNLQGIKCHHACGSPHTCEATAWGQKRCRGGNGLNHNKGSKVKVLTSLMYRQLLPCDMYYNQNSIKSSSALKTKLLQFYNLRDLYCMLDLITLYAFFRNWSRTSLHLTF